MTYSRIAFGALLLFISGCIPAALQWEDLPAVARGQHRLDKAFADYDTWTQQGPFVLDTYSCHSPRYFNDDAYAHAQATYLYALMSNNAYGNPDDKPFFDLPGWTLVRRAQTRNGFAADLYMTSDRSRAVIAYRGTNFSQLSDWVAANVSLLPVPPQYAEAQRMLDEVQEDYPHRPRGHRTLSRRSSRALSLAQHLRSRCPRVQYIPSRQRLAGATPERGLRHDRDG